MVLGIIVFFAAVVAAVIGMLMANAINFNRFGSSGVTMIGTPAMFAGACVLAAGGFSTALTIVGVVAAALIFGAMFRGAAS